MQKQEHLDESMYMFYPTGKLRYRVRHYFLAQLERILDLPCDVQPRKVKMQIAD